MAFRMANSGLFFSPKTFVWLSGIFLLGFIAPTFLPAEEKPGPTVETAPIPNGEETAETPVNEDTVAEQVHKILAGLKDKSAEAIWNAAEDLETLCGKSRKAREAVEEGLTNPNEWIQLAAGRTLCRVQEESKGLKGLLRLIKSGKYKDVRMQAANTIRLMGRSGRSYEVSKTLREVIVKESDDRVKIALGRCLSGIGDGRDGRRLLLSIAKSKTHSQEICDEATLALAADGGLFLQAIRMDIKPRLKILATEPTDRGERARRYLLDYQQLVHNPDERLFREVLFYIQRAYPDITKAEDKKTLYENAIKGMVGSLDPFCQYMDRKEVKATQTSLRGNYGGIGAYVGERNGMFIIISPIYGSPADKAGLEAQDWIMKVGDKKTSELMKNGGMAAVINKLKGKPDTKVSVTYMRRGFTRPIQVEIKRGLIRIDSVYADMLPGNLGYLRLSRFSERSATEMEDALEKLFEERKAKGLVLDLRNNPGGLLKSAVEISDLFLNKDKLVVYSLGRPESSPRRDFYTQNGNNDETYPLVVLVNGGSASAAEIVSGALQDHKRAKLVGDKTFGKGSVQQLLPMQATNEETQLRITIAKYFLPSDRCIHEVGIAPDLTQNPDEVDDWSFRRIIDLRKKELFEKYVDKYWYEEDGKHRPHLRKLAEGDGGKWETYPCFEDFFKTLEEHRLDKNYVRMEVRRLVRRKVEGERKKEFVYDLESDKVLRRGVFELLRMTKTDPKTMAEYKGYPEEFKEEPKSDELAAKDGETKDKKSPENEDDLLKQLLNRNKEKIKNKEQQPVTE